VTRPCCLAASSAIRRSIWRFGVLAPVGLQIGETSGMAAIVGPEDARVDAEVWRRADRR